MAAIKTVAAVGLYLALLAGGVLLLRGYLLLGALPAGLEVRTDISTRALLVAPVVIAAALSIRLRSFQIFLAGLCLVTSLFEIFSPESIP